MFFPKKIIPEFWYHKERIVGEKGGQYLFRKKWILIVEAVCLITIVPLAVFTCLFYRENRTQAINDLLDETTALTENSAIDFEVFLKQYVLSLRIINSMYGVDSLLNRDVLENIFKKISKTDDIFLDLSVIDEKGETLNFCCTDKFRSDFKKSTSTIDFDNQKFMVGHMVTGKRTKNIFVTIRIKGDDKGKLYLRGIFDNSAVKKFLSRLKLQNITDIFIFDKTDHLITASTFFGAPGTKIPLIKSKIFPTARLMDNPKKNTEGKDFLFKGVTRIKGTSMKLGLIMSDASFIKFMHRIGSHIFIMVCLSVFFVLLAVLFLATYVVQVLYIADNTRKEYLDRVTSTEKLASIGKLATGVAHEINNPLAIINEKAGMLQDLFTFAEEYEEDKLLISIVFSIKSAVKRAGEITHHLLEFVRQLNISVELIDVENLVRETIAFVVKEAKEKCIAIDIDVSDNVLEIITDRGILQQILLHLANNAIFAMQKGGNLSIKIHKNIRKKGIVIIIQDTGCGISTKNQRKIFEPFFSTKPTGTGLGLSVTYGHVRELQGKINVKSEVNKGTSVFLYLPDKIHSEKQEEQEKEGHM